VIAVLDYGIGNLRSAEKALQHLGADAHLVTDPEQAMTAGGVVLPGVGAFGACAAALTDSGLDSAVRWAVERGVPFLGICVGFQLMFSASDESPGAAGLGIWEGRVGALPASERRPQMQWNIVRPSPGGESRLLPAGNEWFYFVHSYAPVPEGDSASHVVGTCEYGGDIVAAMESGAVFGVQFHPEKSGRSGLELLSRFAALCG
jgi:glutamine amidotransferase